MKLFLCFIIAIIAGTESLPRQDDLELEKSVQDCKRQSGASQESVDKVRRGELVDESKAKQLLLCYWKKIGYVDESDNLVIDKIKASCGSRSGDVSNIEKVVDKCAVKRDTPENTVFETVKCLILNS